MCSWICRQQLGKANFFDSSAKPETSSITISWSQVVFSLKPLILSWSSEKEVSLSPSSILLSPFLFAFLSTCWKFLVNCQIVQMIWYSEIWLCRKKSLFQPRAPYSNQCTIPTRPFLIYQKIYLQLVFVWNTSFRSLSFLQSIFCL